MKGTMSAVVGATAVSAALVSGVTTAPAATAAQPTSAGVAAVLVRSDAVSADTTVAQALQPWLVLSQGRNSMWPPETVRSAQYLLDAHGAKLAVDGQFGPKTRAAVMAFQWAMSAEVHGFAVDGIVGPQTWQALVTEALSG